MLDSSTVETTADYWDHYARTYLTSASAVNRAEWLGHPVVVQRETERRGGKGITQWFVDDVLMGRRIATALGVGSGTGAFELSLLQAGAVDRYHLFEISPAATALAKEHAASLGVLDRVEFSAVDMNEICPAVESYELVTFVSSLHHVTALREVLDRVRQSLRPGGIFFATEYVGPDRFAFPPDHTLLSRDIYSVLTPSLTCGESTLPLPDPKDVERADPSEAVHSSEIEARIRERFDAVEFFSRGGCIPFVLWWGLNHDALFDSGPGMALVDLVCRLDEAMVMSGKLPTYFADIVARVQGA